MKKKLLLLNLLLILTILGYSQNTLLWKVTNKNNNNTSYIFGTLHMFGYSFINNYPVITEKLKESNLVITETDTDRQKLRDFYNKRTSTDDLKNIVSNEDYEYLKKILNDKWVDISKYTSTEILLKLRGITPKIKCSVLHHTDTLLMDEYINNLSDSLNIRKDYFETEKEQLDLVENSNLYSWSVLKKAISPTIKLLKSDKGNEKYCDFVNQYSNFDLNYMIDERTSKSGSSILRNPILLKDRNDKWVKKLVEKFNSNNCFVGVGLFHLYFESGLISQLKKLGYTIEPVKMN